MKVFELSHLQQAINPKADLDALLAAVRCALVDFSAGCYDVPMPMQFLFPKYKSDSHIKSGYRHESPHFVVKIANGTLAGGKGIVLVFSAESGELLAIFRDQGWLTTLRTALAGIIASELIPWPIDAIGIVGSGSLARMLHELLSLRYPGKNIAIHARSREKAFEITDNFCPSITELMRTCDAIFTATSATRAIIKDINPKPHQALIALGCDDEHKQELASAVFGKSDILIVDSKPQALKFGDVARSISAGVISCDDLIELGQALKSGIAKDVRTFIADLTGIGAQDVAMAEFALSRLLP